MQLSFGFLMHPYQSASRKSHSSTLLLKKAMGLIFAGGILFYFFISFFGACILVWYILKIRSLSPWLLIAAAFVSGATILLLSEFGMYGRPTSVEYRNIDLVLNGLIRWHSLLIALGIFSPALKRNPHPAFVGMSFGLTISACWWLWHILSLTRWS